MIIDDIQSKARAVLAEMDVDEQKVEELLKVSNDLTWEEIRVKVGWSDGRLSDALYGLVNRKGRVSQSSQDISACTFKFIG